MDETYIRVKGKWVYLYRAVDSSGATIDFLLSAKRDAAAAERFLAKALGGENHPAPRVINTDEHAGYPPAIVRLKAEEALKENCRHRPVQYLNNVLEQDHRAIKRRRFWCNSRQMDVRFGKMIFWVLCRQDLRPERWNGHFFFGQRSEVELVFLDLLC